MNNPAENYENNQNFTTNWQTEVVTLNASSEQEFTSDETMNEKLTTNSENNQHLKKQINVLLSKLKQSYHVIKNERVEKQNTVALLKKKLHEIHNLHSKINTMNETIKCCQEHISIERENYHATKNKTVYLTSNLQAAEKTIKQKDILIENLKTEHEKSMRKAKILIDEFYQYKFLEETTYYEERELIEEENNI